MTKPAVLFGGPSPEHDISVTTGLMATHILGDVEAIYWDKAGSFHLVAPDLEAKDFAEGVPRKARELTLDARHGGGFLVRKKPLDIDVVLLATHGGPGEDGTLQGVLDLCAYRYSGPGQAGSALGMDKLSFGAAVAAAGMSTLPRRLLTPEMALSFDGPYILKPRFGGSSIGIEIVDDIDTAHHLGRSSPHFSDGAVVEPFLAGCRDLQIGVRRYPEFQLSAIEEPLQAESGLYSYQQKYLAWGESGAERRRLPADLDAATTSQIHDDARRVADLVGVRGVARVDFLVHEGTVYVNEINTIPGSLAHYLWIDPPVSREQLLADLIAELRSSTPRRFNTQGADGTALRSAGTIASKLG